MKKKLPFLALAIMLSSCLPSNIHIMPGYKNREINDENAVVVETRLNDNGYTLLDTAADSVDWLKEVMEHDSEKKTKLSNVTDLFSDDQDSLSFTPAYFNITNELQNNSTFRSVSNYSDNSLSKMKRRQLLINEDDPINMYLPADGQPVRLSNNTVNYILFIQFPENIYFVNGKITLDTKFCFWDRKASRIISYGRFNSFNLSGYDMNAGDFKYEFVRRVLIEGPFYRERLVRHVKLQKQKDDGRKHKPEIETKDIYKK